MKFYRRTLPSLDSLKFFEAASRCMNFTEAASELYVSQAAVSKRIQQLENTLGVQLFFREGRHLELTEQGKQLRGKAAMALDYLETAINDLTSNNIDTVRISSNSAVSLFWLLPRMKVFGLSDQACAVDLVTTDKQGELASTDCDLSIVYSDGKSAEWNCTLLFREELAPVASPDLIDRLVTSQNDRAPGSLADFPPTTLLNYARAAPDWINWDVWIEKIKIPELREWPTKSCMTYAHTIGRACEGEGIALGSLGLLNDELKTGQLVRLGSEKLVSDRGYYLAHPSNKNVQPTTRQVFDFLLNSK